MPREGYAEHGERGWCGERGKWGERGKCGERSMRGERGKCGERGECGMISGHEQVREGTSSRAPSALRRYRSPPSSTPERATP